MSDSAPPAETIVPVKVPEPEGHAPPTLAEPASGPVAELPVESHQELQTTETAPAERELCTNGDIRITLTPPEPTSTNGDAQPAEPSSDKPAEAESEKPAEPAAPTQDEDSEMKDAEEPATETSPAAPATDAANGTPAPKGKRKSSVGVPEHRSKTLKKKQSKAKITHLDAKPGDFYFARLRSYPPWPSVICDEEMLPAVLLNSRPVTAMQEDGTYKEPYVDGGKKVGDRTFAVMFLHTNEL